MPVTFVSEIICILIGCLFIGAFSGRVWRCFVVDANILFVSKSVGGVRWIYKNKRGVKAAKNWGEKKPSDRCRPRAVEEPRRKDVARPATCLVYYCAK